MGVKRVAMHCVDIENKPGSLHRFLSQSGLSGVDYLCFVVFPCGNNRGRVFVSAKDPKTFESFTKEAKIKTSSATGFIVDGEDRIGAAAKSLKGFAESEISGVVGFALASNGKYQMLSVVDSKDADRAQKALSD